ncbi:hypothetical protein CPT_Moabite_262 [Serratia phage Moabite]|uniref:Uncharacterized protein n=2 Tax=Moabitevirus moabite TaxID=2846181 RepID=A0A7T3NBY0_9CAUD|nr:hypothetical protein HWC48_gp154 [Serratia phage Moabite]QDB71292.1 hypothetical protein CPT_Moabite_262 [Serratia phage Moabite]QPX76891.1 hypothetical protein [Serratia phage vB_SmaM_Yaphecito]UGO54145.1 hypothetical protein HAYMO_163 [Serratia phage vB_SmaM_Haymo]UQT03653.1 hypothetical protein KODAMA_01860 [Serratia phage vB_SmaM-Kodama]
MFSPMFEMIGNFLNGCPRSFITTDGSVTLEEMKGWFGNGYNIVVFTPPEDTSKSRSYLAKMFEQDAAELESEEGEKKIYFYESEETDSYLDMAILVSTDALVEFSRYIDVDDKNFSYINATIKKCRGYESYGKVTLQLPMGYPL